ncbi:MAG: hypothetical protein A4E25_01740 [Methanobacterium sp. PtaB.Bin024]|nr:MAG: hypothetical protein A4E25_01740 [Methanobacterium sp. PtaB.Bin024]
MGKNKIKDRLKENLKEPNPTAEFVASHRAAESLKPENERICYDPYAIHFLNPETLEIINDPVKLKAITEMAGPSVRRWVLPFESESDILMIS